jgi:radical SAM protein with 4Fe4S-binding SPASM domain
MTREKGIMPWELFTKIIDEVAVADKNVRVWMVFFGEALILKKTKPTIFDMITYAKSKGLTDVVLNSNANLMDEDAARRLIESGLDAIYFGIDAFTPETYAKLRVGGNYKRVINNIRNLITLKKKINVENPEIYVQFVEMDINTHEKEDFIRFWEKQGVTVKIRPKISWGGLIEAPNLILSNKNRWPCYWAMQTMSITDTGKVVKCAVDLDARFIAGDVNTQSLKEIWNKELKKIRQLHISKEFNKLPDDCRECRDWQSARADYYSLNT